jgi:hypothetical protein
MQYIHISPFIFGCRSEAEAHLVRLKFSGCQAFCNSFGGFIQFLEASIAQIEEDGKKYEVSREEALQITRKCQDRGSLKGYTFQAEDKQKDGFGGGTSSRGTNGYTGLKFDCFAIRTTDKTLRIYLLLPENNTYNNNKNIPYTVLVHIAFGVGRAARFHV